MMRMRILRIMIINANMLMILTFILIMMIQLVILHCYLLEGDS